MKTLFSIGLTLGPKGPDVKREYRELIESQFASVQQFKEQRFTRLQALLVHAQHNCPFYANRFEVAGFQPQRMTHLEEFQQLPRLTKDDLVKYSSELIAKNLSDRQIHRSATGGSTGGTHRFFSRQCLPQPQAGQPIPPHAMGRLAAGSKGEPLLAGTTRRWLPPDIPTTDQGIVDYPATDVVCRAIGQ